jgi:hypothetical protein
MGKDQRIFRRPDYSKIYELMEETVRHFAARRGIDGLEMRRREAPTLQVILDEARAITLAIGDARIECGISYYYDDDLRTLYWKEIGSIPYDREYESYLKDLDHPFAIEHIRYTPMQAAALRGDLYHLLKIAHDTFDIIFSSATKQLTADLKRAGRT